ncbi:Mitochondrial-processing peptidase subunit alpha, partial [Coemansia sp. RSA 1804]
MHEIAFQTGTLGNPLLCPLSQLDTVTSEALHAYHKQWYRPERIVVAAVGLEHETLVQLCKENGYGDLGSSPSCIEGKGSWIASSRDGAANSGTKAKNGSALTRNQAVYTGGTWFDYKPNMDFSQVYLGFKSTGVDDERRLYLYATLQMLL